METQTLCEPAEELPVVDYHSNVDTSSPFSSVKEAVAVFGERFLTGEIYSHKPSNFTFPKQESPWKYSSSALITTPMSKQTSWGTTQTRGNDHDPTLVTNTLKKLEAELKETKMELKLLKERESETEVALASLNAELHKNMSKIAQAEADEAARVVAARSSSLIVGGKETRRDMIVRMDQSRSPTLAQILSVTEKDHSSNSFGDEKKKKETRKNTKKKKPIIPLLGDLFSRKKGSSSTLHNPLFSSTHMFWN